MLNRLHLNDISTDDITSFFHANVKVAVLRLDKIHPVISGNKWFKLRYYLEEAIQQDKNLIVTFGGAWSNHISATAAICKEFRLTAIGIIRGERPPQLSATLQFAESCGMQLRFISRDDYRDKLIPPDLQTPAHYIIPEGGYGPIGAAGIATLATSINSDISHCICATGTGTMLAGLINSIGDRCELTGISVLKNNHSIEREVEHLLHNNSGDHKWPILHNHHAGGYAKYTPDLISFMNEFFQHTKIPTDFVYTGKLFYAVKQLIEQNYFPDGSRVVVVHSGGLQGNTSLPQGMLNF